MEDLLKRFVYTGVGMVAFTTEKFQETIDRLVAERKLSTEEGKKIINDFFANTETKKEEFESQMTNIVERIIKTFNFATHSDIEKLNKRIKALEANDAALEQEVEAVKSTTVKKKTVAPAAKKTTSSTTANKDEANTPAK
ncbi:MAG: hypothetical protein JJT94_13640 [Bernardetiaceae bacterium]|nr:hypothetical protein [Bernardetiaceae bacterium]